jgi:transcriptional regulator with XRE-family HTH domain
MTPADLKSARKSLGLSQAGLARIVGAASDRTIRRWEDGSRDIPPHVPLILGLLDIPAVRRRLGLDQKNGNYIHESSSRLCCLTAQRREKKP